MNVVVFGASGMVGGGVLLECLDDPQVQSVLSVGRRTCGVVHPKLRELLHDDLFQLEPQLRQLAGLDACFFCLGVSAAGMSEAAYRRVTQDLTIMVATALVEASPGLTFCFVTGQGTDSTGTGRFMWARVKGETENQLLAMPLDAYMFRPGFIQPLRGVRSRTRLYQTFYSMFGLLLPLLERALPNQVTTTVKIGRAMLAVARNGAAKRVLEVPDINALAASDGAPRKERA